MSPEAFDVPGEHSPHKKAMELFQKAYELQMRGELENAIRAYRQSLEALPTAEAHTFLGWTYSFLGMYEDAIGECKKAIELDPDFGNPYNDIGAYLIELGQLDEAIGWLQKAIAAKRYESYCFPYYNLGRIYEAKWDWSGAIEHYRKALNENPNYTLASNALAMLEKIMSSPPSQKS